MIKYKKEKKVGNRMKTALENYFKERSVQVTCDAQDEGQRLSIRYELENGEWAVNTVTFSEHKLILSVWNSLGNTTWDIVKRHEKGVSEEMEETFIHMMQSWGFLLQQVPQVDLILLKIDTGKFGHDAFTILQKSGFMVLEQGQRAFIKGHFGYDVNFLGMMGKTVDVTHTISLAAKALRTLHEKKENDLTMESHWDLEKRTLRLFYRGAEEVFTTSVQDDALVLSTEKEKWLIKDEEAVTETLSLIFDQLKQKETPSRKHFDQFMKDVHIRVSYVDSIYEQLLVHYSWMDIESFAAKKNQHIEQSKKSVLYGEEMKLFRYLQHYIVLDYTIDDMVFYEDKEPAIAHFENHVLNEKKRKLTQQIQLFLKDSNQPD